MPKRVLTAPLKAEGQRVDRFVADMLPERSRTAWQREIDAGHVLIYGRPIKARDLVHAGDEVEVSWTEPEPRALWSAGELDRSLIVYEDAWILVVNKPRGLVVHPSRGHQDDSVVHRVAPLLGGPDTDFRPGVVHRLDQNTTGLLVLARDENTRARLSKAIAERLVHRRYIAVVTGQMTPALGMIDAPIGRHPQNRLKMAVILGGRSAVTHYRSIAQCPGYTLIQLSLETGRTHQIRVHLAAVGHPVVGDPDYGGQMVPGLGGQALHAAQLAFLHPHTGQPLCFTAYPPDDWARLNFDGWQSLTPWVFEPIDGCSPILTTALLDRVAP